LGAIQAPTTRFREYSRCEVGLLQRDDRNSHAWGQPRIIQNHHRFLIEAFLFHRRTEFNPTGSATQTKEDIVSTEADESYEIQGFKLAVEIDFTNSSTSKLERYEALATDEVWIWEDGLLDIYWLQPNGYEKNDRSRIPVLEPIDRALMAECILLGETSRIQAAERLLAAHP